MKLFTSFLAFLILCGVLCAAEQPNIAVFLCDDLNRTKPLFWYYVNALGQPRVSMRDGDWKLAATLQGNPRPQRGPGASHSAEWSVNIKTAVLERFELYNLAEDHREQTDVAAKEPQCLAEMKRKMQVLFDEVQKDTPALAGLEILR
ncbi:MAG: hypothetical protein FWE67_05045 [Planctomycetaceae bacterium]|nr:hypothetical protein [Planctomycetaceae bacterium]